MVVVAEGVETATQLAQLRRLECDEIQGFLLARPLNAEEFEKFLRGQMAAKRPETKRVAGVQYLPGTLSFSQAD
jgi:sensor c-di-GMP phosphodiesterase-like protein